MSDTIKTIRRTADLIRYAVGHSSEGSRMIEDIERSAREGEKAHRRFGTRGGRRYRSVPLAVDLFLVKTIQDAVVALTVGGRGYKLRKTLPVSAILVRGDYAAALRFVARFRGELFSRRYPTQPRFTQAMLRDAAELCDYTEVVCL